MKEIKTRNVVKDIKRLDRFPNVLDRVKRSSARAKRQVDNDKATSQSPVEYAQRQSAAATKKTIRAQMGMSLRINKRLIRHILKRQSLPDGDSVISQSPIDVHAESSIARTPRLARSIRLRKPVNGKYVLSSGSHSGKQRFIRSRVNARLLHRSRTGSYPELMQKRDIGHPKPAGNLIANAVKFTPPGGSIRIRLDVPPAWKEEPHVVVQVSDTGCGVLKEDIPYLFDRFYRGKQSRKSHTGGAGLGLAIAKEIMDLHEGRIGVESEPNAGSTFYFTLPVRFIAIEEKYGVSEEDGSHVK